MCSGAPDAPGSHGTWNGRLVKGFDPLPGEHVFQKHRYSSFYGTAFNEYLREHDAEYLVICGSSTANCVITTDHERLGTQLQSHCARRYRYSHTSLPKGRNSALGE
jgi:isochorismate hydrolase